MEASPNDYDVIVIGAGAAGLSCAALLKDNGKKVLVLEAQDRIGGRINTVRERGVVEAGAEFIHGENAVTWDIVRSAGIATEEWKSPDGSEFQRLYGEEGSIRAQDPLLLEEVRATRDAAYAYEGKDQSLADYLATLPISEKAKFLTADSISVLEATEADRLSVLGLATADKRATNGDRNFWVNGGYDQVPLTLARDIEVRLNAPVVRVVWGSHTVTITCKDGQVYSAARVVLTVSLGVLQQNSIEFVPSLPERFTHAANAIGFGDTTKLTLWLEGDVPEFQILSTNGVFRFWQRAMGTETVITGYTGGDASTELTRLSEQEAIHRGIEELKDALDPKIEDRITHSRHFTWSDNPYVLGSYSFPTVGMGDARTQLAEPIEETIYYTGEAVHTEGHASTVHGAIEMGRMTAKRILENS